MSGTGATTVPVQLDRTPDDYARTGVEPRSIKPWEDGMRSADSPDTYEIRFSLPADATPAELPPGLGQMATRDRNVEISSEDPSRDLLALIWWAAGRGAGRLDGLTVTRLSPENNHRVLPGRPHVPDDNPYSESPFKTLKHHPTFPDRFGCVQDARAFCQGFVGWYNHEHRHSGSRC
jgi:hypothetical protein